MNSGALDEWLPIKEVVASIKGTPLQHLLAVGPMVLGALWMHYFI